MPSCVSSASSEFAFFCSSWIDNLPGPLSILRRLYSLWAAHAVNPNTNGTEHSSHSHSNSWHTTRTRTGSNEAQWDGDRQGCRDWAKNDSGLRSTRVQRYVASAIGHSKLYASARHPPRRRGEDRPIFTISHTLALRSTLSPSGLARRLVLRLPFGLLSAVVSFAYWIKRLRWIKGLC